MKFSIVIPGYNEEKLIDRPIKALLKQSVPRKNFEIIVVDNNSTDKTKQVSRKAGADIVVTEKEKGTNLARQKGVDVSQGKIIAFLDADCEPPQDWLKKIEKILKQKGVSAVSGPYDYGFTGWRHLLERLYTHLLFTHLDTTFFILFGRRAGEIMGGNFATTRKAIEKIGGLPPIIFHGDDSSIAMLMARNVGRVIFTTDLIVKSSPRRFEKRGLFRTTLLYAYYYFKSYFSIPGK